MAKGTKLSEFEKGNSFEKSQKISEILKALGCSKTVTCNYLKSPNKDWKTRKIITIQEKCSQRKLRQHQKYWKL